MSFNTTVLSSSPLLSYVPQLLWTEGNASDPHLGDYSTQSYRNTDGRLGNASVSFRWNGTGVWVYGGYRSRLGPYQVSLDNTVFNKIGYEVGQEEQFQYLLFGGGNLPDGPHELILSNASPGSGNSVLDLDYIRFESKLPQNGKVDNMTLDASTFIFSPGMTSWQVSSETYYTSDPAGAVRISFIVRNNVAVYGDLSNSSSSATAILDSWDTRQLRNNIFTNTGLGNQTNQLIYFASGLGDTEHELVIYNNPSWESQEKTVLSIAQVVTHWSSATNTHGSYNGKHRMILIVATTVGACIFAFGIFLILSELYKKWRRERGMHVIFDYSKAPRPYPVLFFINNREPVGDRSLATDRTLRPTSEALRHRRKPELPQEDISRPEVSGIEVGHSKAHIGGSATEQVWRASGTAGKTSTAGDLRTSDRIPAVHNSTPMRQADVILLDERDATPSEPTSDRGGSSLVENTLRVPPVPSPIAQIRRAGSDRVAIPYTRPPPTMLWQSQVTLDWPGEAPPRYREML